MQVRYTLPYVRYSSIVLCCGRPRLPRLGASWAVAIGPPTAIMPYQVESRNLSLTFGFGCPHKLFLVCNFFPGQAYPWVFLSASPNLRWADRLASWRDVRQLAASQLMARYSTSGHKQSHSLWPSIAGRKPRTIARSRFAFGCGKVQNSILAQDVFSSDLPFLPSSSLY